MIWLTGLIRNSFLQNHEPGYICEIASALSSAADWFPYPENLPGDVRYPVFFQSIPFRVLHEVCDRACSTKLHNKLQNKHQHASTITHSSRPPREAKYSVCSTDLGNPPEAQSIIYFTSLPGKWLQNKCLQCVSDVYGICLTLVTTFSRTDLITVI